ncbi:carbohydrate ABC transporter permease [Paenibacillus psychroresistens]|uniref:Carbohydrate ABC transporter permease n=1 Tax=Paenibacillus psychroresistens TaxID=1778678 RepID=A0A6B8RH85_9BACL|nr:carbohydrate ABC transporter permease [Paenibacillus psychroresistens]QGQ94883.1 carbohydrate ABC transporter permease [Paenibacillus psychroresistens]
MLFNYTQGQKIFNIFNLIFLTLTSVICLVPFVHILAVSFSEDSAITGGLVSLWPVRFTLDSYMYVIEKDAFWRAFVVTLKRVAMGTTLNVFLVILLAYPLSKSKEKFRTRSIYVWFFFFTMLFSGGLIPSYILISKLGLMNTIWALVLPGAVTVFNIILMLNFFREVPEEIEDAANIDGANHWRTLWQIYVPLSTPAIATITLFCIVGHWNSWFDGLIYMSNSENYPLQSYLQTIVVKINSVTTSATEQIRLAKLNDRSIRGAQMVVASVPILIVYPFLQKYFVSGIRLGSVKG